MAKTRKKPVNPWDIPQDEIKEVSSQIVQNTTASPSPTEEAEEKTTTKTSSRSTSTKSRKTKSKTTKKAAKEKEEFAVIRVGKSFHKRAKIAALMSDMKLGEYIESLIDKATK